MMASMSCSSIFCSFANLRMELSMVSESLTMANLWLSASTMFRISSITVFLNTCTARAPPARVASSWSLLLTASTSASPLVTSACSSPDSLNASPHAAANLPASFSLGIPPIFLPPLLSLRASTILAKLALSASAFSRVSTSSFWGKSSGSEAERSCRSLAFFVAARNSTLPSQNAMRTSESSSPNMAAWMASPLGNEMTSSCVAPDTTTSASASEPHDSVAASAFHAL
mmetsp:Transcript_17369/g.41843  ORF Transcript_17369/g.41843 Transcript_17369/m.41843 type:complete len:229 (+) Transcript_17369:2341-3027(+)